MDIIKTTEHKARKPHICNYCGFPIQPGEHYQRDFIHNSGETYEWKSHTDCYTLTGELNMMDHADEGITSDLFYECVNDYHQQYVIGSSSTNKTVVGSWWEFVLKEVKEFINNKNNGRNI